MFVSQTVLGYLDRCGVDFDLLAHPHTLDSAATAYAAHVPPEQLAKGVLLREPDRYVLAVVPASKQVNPFAVRALVDAELMALADEREMEFLFRDCAPGAVPVVGAAFGIKTAVDDRLLAATDVYFEAGDHEHLVHMDREHFQRLMQGSLHGLISC